jgi:hypothetical protein
MEDCPAQAATEDSGNRIPGGTKAVFFHCGSGDMPPTAPLTASMIKLVISIGDLSCLFFLRCPHGPL